MLGSIALMIQQKATEHPEKVAIYVGEENCTYATLAKNNRKAALYLSRKGIKADERIVVEADHILDYVYLWYGIQLLGATFVPVEKSTPSNRIRKKKPRLLLRLAYLQKIKSAVARWRCRHVSLLGNHKQEPKYQGLKYILPFRVRQHILPKIRGL